MLLSFAAYKFPPATALTCVADDPICDAQPRVNYGSNAGRATSKQQCLEFVQAPGEAYLATNRAKEAIAAEGDLTSPRAVLVHQL